MYRSAVSGILACFRALTEDTDEKETNDFSETRAVMCLTPRSATMQKDTEQHQQRMSGGLLQLTVGRKEFKSLARLTNRTQQWRLVGL